MKYPQVEFPSVIDSSMMSTYKTCPQKMLQEYMFHWKPRGEKVDLHAGKAFATGIERARTAYFVENKDPETAVQEGFKALMVAYGDYECPADSPKSLGRMADALLFYYEHYPLDRDPAIPHIFADGKRGIEFSFAEPVDFKHPVTGEPLIYCGRLDAIADFMNGLYMVDEKTTKSLGPTWGSQWHLRSQFTAYAWGCKRSKIDVQGTIVRGISILKTKYDHQQAITYRPDWQVDRWYEELIHHLSDMQVAWERLQEGKRVNFYYNLDSGCSTYGTCVFTDVCRSKDPKPWLRANFEQRVWDPLKREEYVLPPPKRRKFTLTFEAEVEGTTTDEALEVTFAGYPIAVLQERCEGPIETKVEPVLPPLPEGVEGLIMEPTEEGVRSVVGLLDQFITD